MKVWGVTYADSTRNPFAFFKSMKDAELFRGSLIGLELIDFEIVKCTIDVEEVEGV